jgi:hypothetical protein
MEGSTITRFVAAALVMVVVVAVAAVGIGAAGAGTTSGNSQYGAPGDQYAKPFDSASGSGERSAASFAPRKISFSATSGPTGVSGYARSLPATPGANPLLDFSGSVTCLLVQGNRAVVGGVIQKAQLATSVGATFMFAIEDNGNPSAGTADRLSAYFIDPTLDPQDCTIGAAGLYPTFASITSGNFNAYDAP